MKENEKVIFVESLVSKRTGDGRVNIYLQESGAPSFQLSIDAARHLAGNIFQAAEAALTDSVLFRAGETLEEPKIGAKLVGLLREQRNK